MDVPGAHGSGGTALAFTGEAIPMRRDIDLLKGGQPKTLNEMEAELHSLHKENFDLKMTIYYQKDKIERLNGGEMDSGERERDLEEHIADLEYRMQEKDARLEELEAFLAHHHQQKQVQGPQDQERQDPQLQSPRDLKDEMRQVSAEAVAEAQEALAREKAVFEARLGELQQLLHRAENEKRVLEGERVQAKEEAEENLRKMREMEAAKKGVQTEMETRLSEAQEALRDTQARHQADLARVQEKAAEALSAVSKESVPRVTEAETRGAGAEEVAEETARTAEALRLRAEMAEQQVREMALEVDEAQQEARRLRAMRGEEEAAASASAKAAVWRETLEATRQELRRERSEKEAALRSLDEEREALRQERGAWRQGERGAWAELTALRDQVATEQRAKDALLLDMADIRRHGKQQLRELLGELKEFDRVVERNFAELFEAAASAAEAQDVPINTPLKDLLAAEEDASRRRGLLRLGGMSDPSPTKQLALALEEERGEGGLPGGRGGEGTLGESRRGSHALVASGGTSLSMPASGKLMVRQAQDLVRKWRLKLEVLPSFNQRFRDAIARAGVAFESRLAHMTERLASQGNQVQDAYDKLERLQASRRDTEEDHAREVARVKRRVQSEYQELLAEVTAEKNALTARVARMEVERTVAVEEAKAAGKEEAAAQHGQELLEKEKGLQAAKEEVVQWTGRWKAETEGRERVEKELKALAGEKREIQTELDRLLRQLQYRDDVIAVLKEALDSHGLGESRQITAQLALLERHMSKVDGEGRKECGRGGQRVVSLIKEGMEHAAAHLMTVGASQGWETGELLRRADELQRYGFEVAALVTSTKQMLEELKSWNAQCQGPDIADCRSGGGKHLVEKLLEDNARLARLLRELHQDLQHLVQRVRVSSPRPGTNRGASSFSARSNPAPVGNFGSPLRRAAQEALPHASPSLDRLKLAAHCSKSSGGVGVGCSNREANSNHEFLRRGHIENQDIYLQSSRSLHSRGESMTGPFRMYSGHSETGHVAQSSLDTSLAEASDQGNGAKGQGVLARHQIERRGQASGSKPLANLEKISNDLQEIAAKLEHFKSGVKLPGTTLASSPEQGKRTHTRRSRREVP